MGTFSRMLLPSIRMSFMVLPPELLSVYQKRGEFYNQTASKAEQIALCQFIRDGHLEAQIRKSRRLYLQKAKLLCEDIQELFGEKGKSISRRSGLPGSGRASDRTFWRRNQAEGRESRRRGENG